MVQILLAGLDESLAAALTLRLGMASVRAVQTGQEALREVAAGDWSLLILNEDVGDAPAADVLTRIRTELGLTGLPVIGCLDRQPTSSLSARLVDELDVIQLVYHPLDLEELAQQAAAIVGIALPPAPDESAVRQATMAAVVGLWEQLRDSIVERLAIFEEVGAALASGTLSAALRRDAKAEAHKLTGSVGSVGFFKAARLAREIEQLLRPGAPLGRTEASHVAALTADLRRELDQSPLEQPAERLPYDGRPLLLVVDDDLELVPAGCLRRYPARHASRDGDRAVGRQGRHRAGVPGRRAARPVLPRRDGGRPGAPVRAD